MSGISRKRGNGRRDSDGYSRELENHTNPTRQRERKLTPLFLRRSAVKRSPSLARRVRAGAGITVVTRTWSTFSTCSARWNRAPLISAPVLSLQTSEPHRVHPGGSRSLHYFQVHSKW